MSEEYDNTNRGVMFKPYPESKLTGQGRINVNGQDFPALTLRQQISKDGRQATVLYVKAAVLWDNDEKRSENSPDKGGDLEAFPGWRVSAWAKATEDGRKYLSLSASPKQSNTDQGQTGTDPGAARAEDDPPPQDPFNDEIPF